MLSKEEIRGKIDSIDAEIISLLRLRMELAKQIGRLKLEAGEPVRDGQRERTLIEKLTQNDASPMDANGIKEIYEAVMNVSRRLQEDQTKGADPEGRQDGSI